MGDEAHHVPYHFPLVAGLHASFYPVAISGPASSMQFSQPCTTCP
jgi:hypothetical protein